MKIEKNILIAFILNFAFSVFEFIGGIYIGSIAIISDAIHDAGDAASIGLSFFLEKKSRKQPDDDYTYGYLRYSLLGSLITNSVLFFGSVFVIYNAVTRIITPTPISYDGMIVFSVVGLIVNLFAAFFTHGEGSLNQKAVNLHMLEDCLGWAVVLIGAVIMKFTDLTIIDPIMSVGVALFILINAAKNLKEVIDIFLEKTPHNIDINKIKEDIKSIDTVIDVHHIHIWSMDGQSNYATMHVVTNEISHETKEKIRHKLHEHKINHVTLELETEDEHCHEKLCKPEINGNTHHHHHHH